MKHPSRILVTGAAGIVATALRPHFRESCEHVLLTDLVEPGDLEEGESFRAGDLQDLSLLEELCGEVEAVVHLGGLVGAHYEFEEVLGANIVGTHNVFEAARRAGLRRVVYASSHHVVGFERRGTAIDHRTPPRPNGEYALSKAYGEAAASYYADNFGLEILSIRIGYVGEEVATERRLHTWVSAHDLAQLIRIGLTHPELSHEVVYGISDVPEPFFDNRNATRLGFVPSDRALDHLADPSLLEQRPALDSIEEGVVGGGFASAGFAGDPGRVLSRS